MKDRLILKILEHPLSHNLWVLQPHGVLKEINRRGVSIEINETHCLPTCARLCPSSCEWAPNCSSTQCVSCALPADTASPASSRAAGLSPGETLEWQLQCQSCVASMGFRRLLALQEGSIIAMTVSGNCGSAQIQAAFSILSVETININPLEKELRFSTLLSSEAAGQRPGPQQMMRDINTRLPFLACEVLTRPRLVLRSPSPSFASRRYAPHIALTAPCFYIFTLLLSIRR